MSDPQIVWMDGGAWGKCPDCDDELYQSYAEGGVYHECGLCGKEWWEGEFIKRDAAPEEQKP